MKNRIVEREGVQKLSASEQIVKEINRIIKPNSVIDIGCGIGTFLYAFKQLGVSKVLGIDAPWTNRRLVSQYLNDNEFIGHDFEKELKIEHKFDLVISIEVAEHLSERVANDFVSNLVSAGDVILFSAAIPHQGGQHHVNEQWLTYWEEKFNKHGYILHDVLRPIFWDKKELDVWYKQNLVFFTTRDYQFKEKLNYNIIRNIVHPELFAEKAQKANKIVYGKFSDLGFLKLFVIGLIGYKNYQKLIGIFRKG